MGPTPEAGSPVEEEAPTLTTAARDVGSASPAQPSDADPDWTEAPDDSVRVLPRPRFVGGAPQRAVVAVGETPEDANARFQEEQEQRWRQANLPATWEEAEEQHAEDEANRAPEDSSVDEAVQRDVDRMRGRSTIGNSGVEREFTSDPRAQSTDAQGRGTQARNRGQVTLGSGGLQGEAGRQWERRERDGTNTRTRAHAGVNLADREGSLNVSRATGPEDDRTTTSASASARLNSDGDISGGNVSLSRGRRGRTITLSGGFRVEIDPPSGPNPQGRWTVSGTRTLSASLGGTASGGRGGVGLTGSHSERARFTRSFPDEAAARQWYDSVDASIISRMSASEWQAPESAAEAADMGVGESRSHRSESGVTASGHVNISAFRVGVTAGVSESMEVVVTRNDGEHVRVTFRHRTTGSAGGSVGALGMSAGLTLSHAELEGAILEFEIADGPDSDGYRALDALLHREPATVPQGEAGPGWRVVERSHGDSEGGEASGNLIVAEMNGGASVTDEVVTDDQGTYERNTGERHLAASTALPDSVTEGTIWADSSERFEVETDTRNGGASVSFAVDGANAQQTQRRLASAGGVEFNEASGADSGQWTVSAQLSEAELRRFVRAVHQGRWNPGLIGAAWVPPADRLRERVRASSSMDEARIAVRDFLVRTEDRGMNMIRQVLGEGSLQTDVSLQNSTVWQGRAGRERMQRRIAQLRAQLEEDPEAAQTGIMQAFNEQQRRLGSMRDRDRYRDLPRALREQEIAENEPLLAELAQLRDAASDAIRRAREGEDGPVAREDLDPELRRHHDALEADAQRLERVYREALEAYRGGRAERRLHAEPQRWTHIRTPREVFGSWDHYTCADRHWAEGQRAWMEGDGFKRPFDTDRRALPSTASAEEVDRVRRLSWQAHDKYSAALDAFVAMGQALQRMRDAVERRGDTQQYFGRSDNRAPTSRDT